MICEKCSGRVDKENKRSICGYDNTQVLEDIESGAYDDLTMPRSTRLTVFLYILIFLNLFALFFYFLDLIDASLPAGIIILTGIIIAAAAFEIVLCIFMMRLRKWALITYICITAVTGAVQLLTLDIISVAFKALLLYFVLSKDWEYFE